MIKLKDLKRKKKPKESDYVKGIEDYAATQLSTPISFADPNLSRVFRHNYLKDPVKDLIAENINKGEKTSFLVVGLGHESEELYDYALYSYLASQEKGKNLNDVIKMEMVEVRKKENFDSDFLAPPCIAPSIRFDRNNEYTNFYNQMSPMLIRHPKFYDKKTYPLEVLEFVADKKEDDAIFHADCSIEDFAKKTKKQFDFVSVNNVLPYLGAGKGDTNYPSPFKYNDKPPYERYEKAFRDIMSLVKPGGYLSCAKTDSGLVGGNEEKLRPLGLFEQFDPTEQPGLYRRKKQEDN